VGLTVNDGTVGTDQNTDVSIAEDDKAPYWTSLPSDISISAGSAYNQVNGQAADDDVPNGSSGDPGYLTCSNTGDDCSFTVTVSGSGAGSVGCTTSFTAGSGAETCTLNYEVADGNGLTVASSVTIDVTGGGAVDWTGTSTSGTLGGIRPLTDRVANNYPADWAQVTLNFDGTISSCDVAVTCDTSGSVAVTSTPSGSNCVVSANAGYWPSEETCDITINSTSPTCSGANCGGTDTFVTSKRLTECSPLGGTCGGFIDDGSWGTGSSVEVRTVKKTDFSPVTGTNSYPVYLLLEQGYSDWTTVDRVEQFDNEDGNNDGVFTVTPAQSAPAKITVSWKGTTGQCTEDTAVPAGTIDRDCFQTTTLSDVDARKVVIPMEYTTAEWASAEKYYVGGDIGLTSFRDYVYGPDCDTGWCDPIRVAVVAPVYSNASLADLNMDVIFQPDNDGRTILLCYGDNGNYAMPVGSKLPFNLSLPDLVRQDWTAGCSGGHNSPPDTSWRYYTSLKNVNIVFMELGGLADSTGFCLYRGLAIESLPIFLKAFGTYSATIPASYVDGASLDLGSTPFEIDFRDPDLPQDGSPEGGCGGGGCIGVTVDITQANEYPLDQERVRMGTGTTPTYGDPNKNLAAPYTPGEDVRVGGALFALGGRVPGATASDPGGIVSYQIHMTQVVDDGNFTVFQRPEANPTGGPGGFYIYQDREPWGSSSSNTGVISRAAQGVPSTASDTQLDFSSIEAAMNITSRRPNIMGYSGGTTATTYEVPGASLHSRVFNDDGTFTSDTAQGNSEFLQRPEITNPTHDGFYVPPQNDDPTTNNGSHPINRNGQIMRGTAGCRDNDCSQPPYTDAINRKPGGPFYFVKANRTLNVDPTRYADYFTMYIEDHYGVVDSRMDVEAEEYPANRFWKIMGNLGGASGSSSIEFTLPHIQPGNRTIGSVTANVPSPWEGAGYEGSSALGGARLEWNVVDVIIGTDPIGRPDDMGLSDFDFNNQNFNWYNIGMEYSGLEAHEFIWRFDQQ